MVMAGGGRRAAGGGRRAAGGGRRAAGVPCGTVPPVYTPGYDPHTECTAHLDRWVGGGGAGGRGH